jgi:hypothetical protein
MIAHDECLEKLKQLRGMRTARAELEKKVKDFKDAEGLLNVEVTEYFEMTGQQSINIEGYGMFYLNREVYPQIEDREAVEAWLEGKGDLDLIKTFNTNKFKAYFKELVEENAELPPTCTQFVKTEVRMRRN